MVIFNSDSSGTLVSLENGIKVPHGTNYDVVESIEEYSVTEIYLPEDELGSDHAQRLHLPKSTRVDEYLRRIPEIVESCDELLMNPPVVYNERSQDRIVYVAQGELAFALPEQCDVLMSDQGTTCHILALRSLSSHCAPLTSMAHIDDTSYERCIREMVNEHVVHHSAISDEEKKEDLFGPFGEQIDLQIHILGGFEDKDGTSSALSNWLMHLLADIANDFKDQMRMTLKTCAITSLNDNGYCCPIGRGLAINLLNGNAFLARAEITVQGPAMELRSVRSWSEPKKLSMLYASASNDIIIEPFRYESFPEVNQLLNVSDRVLLRCTSTSPDVEEVGYCESMRRTLHFLAETPCTKIFGPAIDQPLIFRRTTTSSNSWSQFS